MGKLRKIFSSLILIASAGLALFGASGEQSEMYYFAAFAGFVVFSGVWPWAGSSRGRTYKPDLGSSSLDLPIGDCRSRMNRGESGSSSDQAGIDIE